MSWAGSDSQWQLQQTSVVSLSVRGLVEVACAEGSRTRRASLSHVRTGDAAHADMVERYSHAQHSRRNGHVESTACREGKRQRASGVARSNLRSRIFRGEGRLPPCPIAPIPVPSAVLGREAALQW